ncbi:MAG: hypothetical protein OEY05_07615 [Paracoccaceae bacterium]|nr:hypothetical protein [Paracoccaceae bacterium]
MSRDERRGVWALAVGQTLGFASLVYIFGAILVSLEAGSDWGRAELALGPTLGLLVSAAFAPLSGRFVDKGLGGVLLGGAAALGAVCLILLSRVEHLAAWLALWSVVGLAQAGSLYETCFSFLTRRLGGMARHAIIRVTLVAGFASTIAFPLGAYSGQIYGWRGALLIFGLVQLFVTVPANLVGVALMRRGERRGAEGVEVPKGAVRAAMKRPEFWLLAGLFGLILGNHTMLSTFALPVLADRGAGTGLAVLVASSVGPMQVAGRIFLMVGAERIPAGTAIRAVATLLALASLALLLAAGHVWLFFAYAICQGAAAGVSSILRPVLVAEALGRENFGAVSGALAIAPLTASAAAPYAGALLIGAGGIPMFLWGTFLMAITAIGLALLLRARGI